MSTVEIIAVVFSFVSVLYTVKKSIWSWIWGIIGIIFYAIIFLQSKLYSNLLLQGIFLVQSFQGLFGWGENMKDGNLQIEKMNKLDLFKSILFTITLSSFLLILFSRSSYPIMDSTTTGLSIMAYYLTGRRKIESWVFWILADLIYIYMFFDGGLYLSGLLYFVFLIMCIIGIKKWKNAK